MSSSGVCHAAMEKKSGKRNPSYITLAEAQEWIEDDSIEF